MRRAGWPQASRPDTMRAMSKFLASPASRRGITVLALALLIIAVVVLVIVLSRYVVV